MLARNSILGQWLKGNSWNPMVLLAGALLMVLASAIACAIPAWRATASDPIDGAPLRMNSFFLPASTGG
jgi:hypothetical protein